MSGFDSWMDQACFIGPGSSCQGRGMRPHRRVAPYDADVVSSRFLAPKNSYPTLPPIRLFPVLSVLMKNLGIFGPGDEFGSFCPLWLVGAGGGERRCFSFNFLCLKCSTKFERCLGGSRRRFTYGLYRWRGTQLLRSTLEISDCWWNIFARTSMGHKPPKLSHA